MDRKKTARTWRSVFAAAALLITVFFCISETIPTPIRTIVLVLFLVMLGILIIRILLTLITRD